MAVLTAPDTPSTGVAGADLLSTMPARHGEHVTGALMRWERQLGLSIDDLHGTQVRMRSLFVAATRLELALRSVMLPVSKMPLTSALFVRGRTKGRNGPDEGHRLRSTWPCSAPSARRREDPVIAWGSDTSTTGAFSSRRTFRW
jgi:hypothetical protein